MEFDFDFLWDFFCLVYKYEKTRGGRRKDGVEAKFSISFVISSPAYYWIMEFQPENYFFGSRAENEHVVVER